MVICKKIIEYIFFLFLFLPISFYCVLLRLLRFGGSIFIAFLCQHQLAAS